MDRLQVQTLASDCLPTKYPGPAVASTLKDIVFDAGFVVVQGKFWHYLKTQALPSHTQAGLLIPELNRLWRLAVIDPNREAAPGLIHLAMNLPP